MSSPTLSSLLNENCISVLQQPLVLVKVSDVNGCTKPLIQLSFFAEAQTFFSFTVTDDEASVIVDVESFKHLPESLICSVSKGWRAVQVYEGPAAIGETGYIASLTRCLAVQGIGVVYLSTFNTDLLLVKEEDLERTLSSLKTALQKTASSSTPSQSSTTTPDSTSSSNASSTSALHLHEQHHLQQKMILTVLPHDLRILTLDKSLLPTHTHELMRVLYFSDERTFCSFTLVKDEVTLILPSQFCDHFHTLEQNQTDWRAIQIGEGSLGCDESTASVVSLLSDALAIEKIPQYYLSTCETDFTLVQKDGVGEARECLQSRLAVEIHEE